METLNRMGAEPREDVTQVEEGIDLQTLAGRNDAHQDRRSASASVATEKRPVATFVLS